MLSVRRLFIHREEAGAPTRAMAVLALLGFLGCSSPLETLDQRSKAQGAGTTAPSPSRGEDAASLAAIATTLRQAAADVAQTRTTVQAILRDAPQGTRLLDTAGSSVKSLGESSTNLKQLAQTIGDVGGRLPTFAAAPTAAPMPLPGNDDPEIDPALSLTTTTEVSLPTVNMDFIRFWLNAYQRRIVLIRGALATIRTQRDGATSDQSGANNYAQDIRSAHLLLQGNIAFLTSIASRDQAAVGSSATAVATSLAAALAWRDQVVNGQSDDVDAWEASVNALDQALATLVASTNGFEATTNTLDTTTADLIASTAGLTTATDRLAVTQTSIDTSVTSLNSTISQLDRITASLLTRTNNLAVLNSDLRAAIAGLAGTVEAFRVSVASLQSSYDLIFTEIARLDGALEIIQLLIASEETLEFRDQLLMVETVLRTSIENITAANANLFDNVNIQNALLDEQTRLIEAQQLIAAEIDGIVTAQRDLHAEQLAVVDEERTIATQLAAAVTALATVVAELRQVIVDQTNIAVAQSQAVSTQRGLIATQRTALASAQAEIATQRTLITEQRQLLTPPLIEVGGFGGVVDWVDFSGDKAYVARGKRGFEIYSVLDPHRPSLLGSLIFAGRAAWTEVRGNLAYILVYGVGLVIADVEDPTRPSIVSTYQIDFRPSGYTKVRAALDGNFIYLPGITGNTYLWYILDITDPTRPSLASAYSHRNNLAYSARITVENGLGVISTRSTALVMDFSNPTNPQPLAHIVLGGGLATNASADAVLRGGYLYATVDGMSNLPPAQPHVLVFDLSTPTSPNLVHQAGPVAGRTGLYVDSDTLYALRADGKLESYDISNPAQPTLIVTFPQVMTSFWPGGIIGAHYIYGQSVRSLDAALTFVDLTQPSAPVLSQVASLDRSRGNVTISGNYLYMGGLEIYDISNPLLPTPVGETPVVDASSAVASGQYLFVSTHNSYLKILDLGNPALPSVIGSVYTPNLYARQLAVGNGHVYAMGDSFAPIDIAAFDISDPRSPTLRGAYQTPAGSNLYPHSISVLNDNQVIASYFVRQPPQATRIEVVDFSDPTLPVLRGVINLLGGYIPEIRVAGTHVFVLKANTIYSIDVSDPTSPIEIDALALSLPFGLDATRLAIQGMHLYVVDTYERIYMIDCSDPSSLRVESVFRHLSPPFGSNLGSNISAIVPNGSFGYLFDEMKGLITIAMP